MDPGPESQLPVGMPSDVETVRIGKLRGVAVGSALVMENVSKTVPLLSIACVVSVALLSIRTATYS